MAVAARFTGKKDADGAPLEYVGGVPARSLDEDEFAALSDDQKAAVKASSLYTLTDSAEKAATTAERREARAEAAAVKEGAPS